MLVVLIKCCVWEIDFVGCYGGEEFVIILNDFLVEDVKIVVECIR